jgi:phage antirepressor YoqD-like protein
MINEQQIIKLYKINKLTIVEIAKQLQLKKWLVRKILIDNNVDWNRKYISDFTDDQINDIVAQHSSGIAIKNISKQYQISAPAISRILQSNNIQIINSTHKYDDLRIIAITDLQKQFIVGTILGDGCLSRDTEKSNYKLSFGHCEKHKEYFDWKMSIMIPFITHSHKSIDKRGNSIMWQAGTISHPGFNKFANDFYDNNRVKIIPTNLDQYFTPLALAVWIMDDGNLNAKVNMRIASMGFTEQDNYLLQNYLYRTFNLQVKLRISEGYASIWINKVNTQILSDIIRPYIVPCMSYKIMP